MNYKAQLKGWAVDRVIEAKKVGIEAGIGTLAELHKAADELADYCYEPEKDFVDCLAQIREHIKGSSAQDALEKVNRLQAELGVVEEDINRQIALYKAANSNGQGAAA